MDRYGASTREYERNDDFDNYNPRREAAGGVRTGNGGTRRRDRTPDSLDSDIENLRREVREADARHSGPRGDYTTDRFATSDDESEYEPRGGHRQHHHRGGAGAGGARTGNGGTRRRRDDSAIEQLRREVREEEARHSDPRSDFSDDDDGSEFAHRTVTPHGGAGGVRGGNGGTRRRRDDSAIEQLRREVREEEARHSGPRGAYHDDSDGETEFGRRLEREVYGGRRGHGAATRGGVMPPRRGHLDDSDDDGMSRGRRGAFCGGRPS